MDKKLKNENMQKRACLCYILRAIRAGRCIERRYADQIFIHILKNASFRGQIFKIFFASGGKGALTPLTKILRTPLSADTLWREEREFVFWPRKKEEISANTIALSLQVSAGTVCSRLYGWSKSFEYSFDQTRHIVYCPHGRLAVTQ